MWYARLEFAFENGGCLQSTAGAKTTGATCYRSLVEKVDQDAKS